MGYQIVGSQGTGWLSKCGFLPLDDRYTRRAARRFLRCLTELGKAFGLTVVGLQRERRQGEPWLSANDLMRMIASQTGWARTQHVHLRVYAPEDYLEDIRGHFEVRGGLQFIGSSVGMSEQTPAAPIDADDLAAAICKLNIRQAEIADLLGVSQPAVSQFITGSRPWPDRARKMVVELIGEKQESLHTDQRAP